MDVQKCTVCDTTFLNEMLRIGHIRKEHPETLPFTCSCCNRKYENEESLHRHENVMQKRVASKLKASKIEMACIRYALSHGKHKAQLKYAKLHPELQLGWRRITELLSKFNLHEKYTIKCKASLRIKDKLSKIPNNVKYECVKYGNEHGVDAAQIHFTINHPNMVFTYGAVYSWLKQGLEKFQPESPADVNFESSFVDDITEKLREQETSTVGDIQISIAKSVEKYNESVKGVRINYSNAFDEVFHLLNLKTTENKSAKFECVGCGSKYKTDIELTKHKSKCWVPDFKGTRIQRSCRVKPNQSECETVDSDSNTSSKPEEPISLYRCHECDYKTHVLNRYNRHMQRMPCNKKKTNIKKDFDHGRKKDCDFNLNVCIKCRYSHISIEGIREHYRIVHNIHLTDGLEQISLFCDKCSDTFITYAGYREHICGERFIRPKYERTALPAEFAISLRGNTSICFRCPKCVTGYPSYELLKDHYNSKTCSRVDLYAKLGR